MTNSEDTYITAGQLAALHNITKQTVLFYDKNGLLPPAFVKENGYRYYSTSQYLTLSLILSLRKMNLSLAEIRTYLSNRSPAHFRQLLQDKKAECDRIIEETMRLKASLTVSINALNEVDSLPIDTIICTEEAELPLFVSQPLTLTTPLSERLSILSAHTHSASCPNHFRPFDTGWIISGEDFFKGRFKHTIGYYLPLSQAEADLQNMLRPQGMYLTINFRGAYYLRIDTVLEQLRSYMSEHQLKPIGNVFLLPLKDYRQTEDTGDYLNQLMVRVVPIE